MKNNFDLNKYMKENRLGSYGIMNEAFEGFKGTADVEPIKEYSSETMEEEDMDEHFADGDGMYHAAGHEDHVPTFQVDEDDAEEMTDDYSRIMDLGGEQIEQGIISLLDDGFSSEDIMELVQSLLAARSGGKHGMY